MADLPLTLEGALARLDALERERDDLRRVLDNAPAMFASMRGPEHVFTYANPTYVNALGGREVVGKRYRDVLPEVAGQGRYEILDEVYATGRGFRGSELPVGLINGETGAFEQRYFDVLYEPALSAEGVTEGVLIHGVDVTEQVTGRDRIRSYQALVEHAGWGVAIGDPRGDTLVDVNPAFAAMHGYTVSELIGADSSLVFAPTDQARKKQEYVGVPNERGYYRYESLHQRKDGSTFPCLADVMAVKDDHGNVRYRVGNFQDVSEERRQQAELLALNEELAAQKEELEAQRLELQALYERERLTREGVEAEVARRTAQLERADRYKDEFLSVISHELRTPLNFITGFASTLDDEVQGPLNPAQHQAVGKILTGADRMLGLVNDLLDFAKLASGRFTLLKAPLAYDTVVDEVMGLLKPLADRRRLTLTQAVDVSPMLDLDGPRISQVLTNLVGNAIKFTPAGGQVAVRAFVRDGEVVTEVSDTGIGIAADDLARLFGRFQQVDMSATRAAGGTGLGLAIAKALVEAHGGHIGVTSEPRQGSTFWFTLPLTAG